jgi:hypothetical protein
MSIEYYQAPVKMNIVNYQEDVVNKLQIHKTADNLPSKDSFKMLYSECKGDFDCVSTLTEEIIKPDYKITTDHMIAIVPIGRDGDIFRFNKIQLMEDNVVVDNVVIDKIQLVANGRVVIDDLETFNIYFPILGIQFNVLEFRVFINKTSITRSLLDNIMLTYERVYANAALRFSLVSQNYELFEGTKRDNGSIVRTTDNKEAFEGTKCEGFRVRNDDKDNEGNEDCVSYLINPDQSSYTFNRSSDTIYDIEIQTVDINMNKISNNITKVSVQMGHKEVYNKTNTDNYHLEVFHETNPLPLIYLMYHNVKLNIITDEPKQLILIKYRQKNIKNIKDIEKPFEPFYMSPNILIKDGMAIQRAEPYRDIPYISAFIGHDQEFPCIERCL